MRIAAYCLLAGLLSHPISGLASVQPTCDSNTYPVRAHTRKAYTRADGILVSATFVKATCRAKSPAYEKWRPHIKAGAPLHWSRGEKTKSWEDDEVERVIEGIESLPDLLSNQTVNGIYRFKTSEDYSKNQASRVGSNIALYDRAFDQNENMARTLGHELSHILYDSMSAENRDSYRKEMGWIYTLEGRELFLTRRKSGFVEEDGIKDPSEDFANNVEYYLFDQDKLKKITPAAYEWLKKTFGDKLKLKGANR